MPPLPLSALSPGLLAFDMQDFLQSAFQILVLVFFFGAPLLGRGAKQRGATGRPNPAQRPRRRSEAEERGEDIWRQLLEGLEQKPAAAPAPQKAGPRPVAAAAPAAASAAERSAPRPLESELAPGELTDIDFSEIDEEALERAPESAHPVLPEVSSEEIGVGAGASAGIESVSSGEAAAEAQRELASGELPRFVLPRGAQDWRRALLLAEVLAPPVSLRTERGRLMPGRPPGLS
jgi:hypothetical protein